MAVRLHKRAMQQYGKKNVNTAVLQNSGGVNKAERSEGPDTKLQLRQSSSSGENEQIIQEPE